MTYSREVASYIARIRNAAKKQYAKDYAAYVINGRQGREPLHSLTFMGAQAVRMNLCELMESNNETV